MVTMEHVVLPIPLEQPQVRTTSSIGSPAPTLFPTEPLQSDEAIPTYATVLLSLALALLIIVCSVTVTLFCYSSRQRILLMRRHKLPPKEDEESVTSKTSNQPQEKPSPTNTHSRKIRRSKSSVQLLMQKAAEISRQGQLTSTTQDSSIKSKLSLKRSHSLPDLVTLRHSPTTSSSTPSNSIPTSITSNSKAQVATVRPLNHNGPPPSPSAVNSRLTDKSLDIRLDKWRKAHLPQPVTGGAGWYERHKSRQIALASYAQLYLAAGAKTPEPGVSPSTKL